MPRSLVEFFKTTELTEEDKKKYEKLTGSKHKDYPSICRTNKIRWSKIHQNLQTILIRERQLLLLSKEDHPNYYLMKDVHLPCFIFIESFYLISEKIMKMVRSLERKCARVPDIFEEITRLMIFCIEFACDTSLDRETKVFSMIYIIFFNFL